MATQLLRLLKEMSDRQEVELVEANDLDDGTEELVHEALNDLDGVSLIRIYRLFDEDDPSRACGKASADQDACK